MTDDAALINDDNVDLLREVQGLVNQQYDLTVSFCNAQTSLLNTQAAAATRDDDDDDDDDDSNQEVLLDNYATCLRKVQEHWIQLQGAAERMRTNAQGRRVWTVYEAHVARTERVLLTVQRSGGGVWTSHGISLSTNDSNAVTVALATLRASVDTVREILSLYLPKE